MMEARFEQIDERLNRGSARFQEIEGRIDSIETALRRLPVTIALMMAVQSVMQTAVIIAVLYFLLA